MFEIELKNQYSTKKLMYHIVMYTKDARFKIVKRKDCYALKVYTKTHLLDIYNYLEDVEKLNIDNIAQHKITFKIDGIKHFLYIGLPY